MLMLVGLGVGCGKSETGDTSGKIKVTATVGMIGDIVKQVGGEYVEVTGIIPEGVDPHTYRPTRSDVAKLQAADVIFYNGMSLEGKMADTLTKMASDGRKVHAVSENVASDESYVIMDEEDHFDPHIWMDVNGWIKAVKLVAEKLGEFDPSHKKEFETNASKYVKELEKLDAYAKKVIGSIPEKQRVLVTAHDAFGYMGRAYGIQVKGIQGVSTESEASEAHMRELIKFIVTNQIKAIFVETSVNDKAARSIIQACANGTPPHKVIIGGKLFSDAMGAAGTYEGTYIGMIDHNATIIARALGGDAPEKGLNGKLSYGKN